MIREQVRILDANCTLEWLEINILSLEDVPVNLALMRHVRLCVCLSVWAF